MANNNYYLFHLFAVQFAHIWKIRTRSFEFILTKFEMFLMKNDLKQYLFLQTLGARVPSDFVATLIKRISGVTKNHYFVNFVHNTKHTTGSKCKQFWIPLRIRSLAVGRIWSKYSTKATDSHVTKPEDFYFTAQKCISNKMRNIMIILQTANWKRRFRS